MSAPKGWNRTRSPGWLGPVAATLGLGKFESPGGTRVDIPFDASQDAPPDLAAEWAADPVCGTVLGHWLAIRRTKVQTYTTSGKVPDAYVCVSACGIVARLPKKNLLAGAYQACLACKPGFGPRKIGDVSKADLEVIKQLWEIGVSTNLVETTNLKGKEAVAEWDAVGRKVVSDVLSDTPLGRTHGWKVSVRNCHYLPLGKGVERINVQRVEESQHRLSLSVHAKDGNYTFEVDLTTPRTDVKFRDWSKQVLDAIARRSPTMSVSVNGVKLPENGTHPPAAGPQQEPASDATQVPGTVDIQKLLSLRGNIDKVLAVGKDMNEIAAMKGQVSAKLARARDTHWAANQTRLAAEESRDVARDKVVLVRERAADLERRLANARVDVENAQNEFNRTELALASAAREYAPAEEELQRATAEMKDIEALETDRLKVVGDAKGLAALLEALSKVGV